MKGHKNIIRKRDIQLAVIKALATCGRVYQILPYDAESVIMVTPEPLFKVPLGKELAIEAEASRLRNFWGI